jgi:integrase
MGLRGLVRRACPAIAIRDSPPDRPRPQPPSDMSPLDRPPAAEAAATRCAQLTSARSIDSRRPVPVLTIQWGNAKSRKEREIPLTSARVLRFLKSRRLVGGAEGFPFGSAAGERVKNFRKAWETLLRLSRITDPEEELDGDLHWHDLRHECGSRYADRGLDGRHIQMLLGPFRSQDDRTLLELRHQAPRGGYEARDRRALVRSVPIRSHQLISPGS